MPARRLIWQLYASFLAIIVVALGLATFYASRTVHDFYLGQVEQSLLLAAEMVRPEAAGALETKTPADTDVLCKQLGQSVGSRMRLTIIALSGKVLGDSMEDPASMENHSNRPEVIEALSKGLGRSIRPSPTLGQNMMYVAVPVKQGDQAIAVVRFAVPITAVEQTLRATYAHIAWVGGAVALGAAALGLLMSRRITSPIVQMKRTAQLFAAGQLNSRIAAGGAPELAGLAKALNEMAAQLQDRIVAITRQRNESQAVLSSLSEGVLAVDSEGRIVSLNKAASQLLNIDPAFAQGATSRKSSATWTCNSSSARPSAAVNPAQGRSPSWKMGAASSTFTAPA